MKKLYLAITLCITAALLFIAPNNTRANSANASILTREVSHFNDNFSGKTISSWRWETNNLPITLVKGVAQFRSSTNLFPYIFTQNNPFPITQNFSVEFGFRYNNIADRGTGLVVHDFAPAQGDPPYYGTNWQFQVWQDTIRPLQIYLNGVLIYQAPAHDTNPHTAKWVRTDQDRVYLDNTLIYTGPINTANPKAIWIGNFSDNLTPGVWTGFDVDFVRVLRLP